MLGVHLANEPQVRVQVLPWDVILRAICVLSAPVAFVVIVRTPWRTAPEALVVGTVPATTARVALAPGLTLPETDPSDPAPVKEKLPPGEIEAR